ncbi:dipeptidase [Carnobacterium viridans]|uniref:Dipeptidase. Metallo peptidase. MEROPS family M19 n=1 Tax=Carnobacterium viridans TaxID=174587 RepID=A0A1H0YSG4_9LACT|nr:dipeptidase [Carnobacterium viridans]UDE94967.1 dipeptidase [Carnobacterium viridans]SDQ18177.1 dipeptidase. Metallo peptidase. MEROPS family M19 [Carnobacterium viridans]
MNSIDMHCDVLYKMQVNKGSLDFKDSNQLEVNLKRLKEGKVKVQAFAIFIEPSLPSDQQFAAVLEQIAFYQNDVLGKHPEVKQIKKWSDIHELKENEIGSFLTLEGVSSIGNDMDKLEYLLDAGILSVGLTWNPANLAADGVGEPRGGGLTTFGFEIVKRLNERKVFTDVSHLSVQGFWDVMKHAQYPIATHSNVLSLCSHVRNLNDDQIKAMVERDAMIHVIFNPTFTIEDGENNLVTIADLIPHVERLVELGAVNNIGFGSDFDGISTYIEGLSHAGETQNFIQALLERFTEEEVQGFASKNFLNHLPK